MSDYDKAQWQAEQAARDAAMEIQKAKWAKTKERAARNAQRKLDRLARKLSEDGKLTDWEEEFTGSVKERLDKFGSAFHDPQKGRPADALSFAQKKVVAALNKKVKDIKRSDRDADEAQSKNPKPRKGFKNKGGFKNKNYKPRVRDLHEDIEDLEDVAEAVVDASPSVMHQLDTEPFIPEVSQSDSKPPFLRVVK